ncbi:hypothetical protein BG004_006208 [Podila humilis]|nr:hypothetical protein BG004_006208 [Podila humilis]
MFGKKTPSGQDLSIKRHSDNSSNSLVNNTAGSNHSHIPLHPLSTPAPVMPCNTTHRSATNSNISDSNDLQLQQQQQHGIEHDPLPPAVNYAGVSPTARYQFRALGRRALSYHRRQRITNLFCLVLWPVIMVVVCFALANSGGGDKLKNYKVRYCTNEADLATSTNNDDMDQNNLVYRALYPAAQFSSSYSEDSPCVRWFGQAFPNKAPYENVTAADRAQPDSFYTPSLPGGWFNVDEHEKIWREANPNDYMNYPRIYRLTDLNQTVLYAAANADVARALGLPSNVTRSFIANSWPPTEAGIVYKDPENVTAIVGLLGAVPVRYASKMHFSRGRKIDDKEREYTAQTFIATKDGPSLDIQMRDIVRSMSDGSQERLNLFGGIFFEFLDLDKQSIQMTMQYGAQADAYHQDGSGIRQIVTTTQMTSALLRIKYAGKYIITQGLRALPYEFDPNILHGYSMSQTSAYLFPFALSFLLPTFVAILVQEKEDRHRAMMAMNGLKPSSYYLAHYVEFVAMQLIASLFFCFACAAVGSHLVTRTSPAVVIVMMLVWSHAQASFSFFLASFFSRTRKASLFVYFFVAVSAIMGGVADLIFATSGVPFIWYIHPSFAFYSIINAGLRHAGRVNGLPPLHWGLFAPGTDLFGCIMLLFGEGFLFVLMALYLDAVLPSEYGVQKPWHFPISSFFRTSNRNRDIESRIRHSSNCGANGDVLEGADADVYAERERVETTYDPAKTPLIIDNLYHCYTGKVEPALRGLSFGVETNTVLGLLGPNGAGKSTLIHLLTGLYKPTSGTAFVAGANIRTDMTLVHAKIGVCPQHDILWGDLTVADHLLFYSRLRGIPPQLEQQAVTFAVASVSLTKFRDRQVKGLSGGEKRRVSIAISLLGDNAVIFLDEPSTGLDPAVRRVIWDIINRVKVNRTIVLTTHSMEEADILSDKIAIMTLGRLRCIGTSLNLKDLYGSGFRLNVSSKPGRLQQACAVIEQNLMQGLKFRRLDKFSNSTVYEFELSQSGDLSMLFGALSKTGGLYADVEDWGITQTTLEDVFIKIVTEGDSALALPDVVQG